ncbi:FixH family protein [Ectothiorhodospiraceae bacterium 2226]|nr:FixH family protein [Ectothiorhodospiraceae bacterium 2226]
MFTNVALSLLGGIAALVVLFMVLTRLLRQDGDRAAVLSGVIVLGVYIPVALVYWPGADVLAIHLAVFGIAAYILHVIADEQTEMGADGELHVKRFRFHWGPAVIMGFFVVLWTILAGLVMIAQNGLSPELAARVLPEPTGGSQIQSMFPGTVARDFHKKEELYNRYLEQVERQRARGWQVSYGWVEPSHPMAGEEAVFQLRVRDRDGHPVSGADVLGHFMRPADFQRDKHVVLEEVDRGLYRVAVTLPEAGAWHVLIEIRRGEDLHEIQAATTLAAKRAALSGGR